MMSKEHSTADSFESACEALEALVVAMESGELPLQDSMRSYEQGQQLVRKCQEHLAAAARQTEALRQQQDPAAGATLVPAAEFETRMRELEQLVEKFEGDDQSLAESLEHFRQGLERGRDLQHTLGHMEQRVQQLVRKEGTESLAPLDGADTTGTD